MANGAIQGNERGAYVALDTSYVDGTRDGLQGETPKVTEPS